MDRTELVNRIRDGRRELETALAQFEKHELTEPLLPGGWSVKDVIAHVGFWERRIADLYALLVAGDVPSDAVVAETVDALNQRVYEENQLLPLGIAELNEREAYAALLAVAEQAPEQDLFDPDRFPWTEGEPFYHWIVGNTYGHYVDHVPDLLAARA